MRSGSGPLWGPGRRRLLSPSRWGRPSKAGPQTWPSQSLPSLALTVPRPLPRPPKKSTGFLSLLEASLGAVLFDGGAAYLMEAVVELLKRGGGGRPFFLRATEGGAAGASQLVV